MSKRDKPITNSQQRLEELVQRMRERGCRLTPQRMAVLKVLIADEDHPSVQQIYEQVRVEFPMMSLATVYSTVTLLKEMGEVRELSFGDGSSRYDGLEPSPHPHLICTQCGDVVDLESSLLGKLPQNVERETGYQIVNHRLDFFGICPQCQAGG